MRSGGCSMRLGDDSMAGPPRPCHAEQAPSSVQCSNQPHRTIPQARPSVTFLIAIHAGGYARLAADKMESARAFGLTVPLNSEASKIVETPLGAVTGAGLVSLLDAVKRRIQTESVSHTDQMLSVIHDERQRAREQGEASEQDLAYTSWLLTYRARAGEGVAVRCVGFLPSVEDQRLVVVEPGRAMPVFPLDTPPEVVDQVGHHLRSSLRSADGGADTDSLRHHLALVSWALREVARHSTQVSTTFDFAVTTADETWYPLCSVDATQPALDQAMGLERS